MGQNNRMVGFYILEKGRRRKGKKTTEIKNTFLSTKQKEKEENI